MTTKHLATELIAALGLPEEVIGSVLPELEIMARYKYDNYEMFGPGMRFFEHLCIWLKQFEPQERPTLLQFLQRHLIFVSQREMQDLARTLYYDKIVPEIASALANGSNLHPVRKAELFRARFPDYLRRCFFIGLSDGAKIDFFRRHHIQLSQEQVLPYYRTSATDYLRQLRDKISDRKAFFHSVFLIDDFTASGYTLIHKARTGEQSSGNVAGALVRLYEYQKEIIDHADRIYLCHYIATEASHRQISKLLTQYAPLRGKTTCLAGLMLPDTVSITGQQGKGDSLLNDVLNICNRYYRSDYEDENTAQMGGVKLGFGGTALPLVMYSNTPNNSLFFLWFDSRVVGRGPRFHALFRRLPRHRSK